MADMADVEGHGMSRVYRPRHEFGTSKIGVNHWDIYRTLTDDECPKIGEIKYDHSNNMYTAFRLDGTRLDHPSGRAKHFCTQQDAGMELWHEYRS